MIVATQGGLYLSARENPTVWTLVAGSMGLLVGASLLVGFLTPVVGAVAGAGAVGIAASWLPQPTVNLFDAALPTVLVAIVAAAVVFLGPGAASVDARLFGRREIIIPASTRLSKS